MMVSLPRFFHLVFYQIFSHDFLGAVADAVHPAHPLHLVFRFYLLSTSFTLLAIKRIHLPVNLFNCPFTDFFIQFSIRLMNVDFHLRLSDFSLNL